MHGLNWRLSTGMCAFMILAASMKAMAGIPGGAPTLDGARAHFFHLLGLFMLMVIMCSLYILFITGFFAFTLLGRALWPRQVTCMEETVKGNLARSFLLGLVNLLSFLIILLLLRGSGLAGPFLLFFMALLLYFGMKGAPAIPALIGEQVAQALKLNPTPTGRLALGTAVLAGLYFLPVVGWLMILFIKITNFGGSILSTFTLEREKSP